MAKGGRPPKKLTDEQIAQVEALAAYLTSEQIADYLGIGRTTFYSIMDREPEVSVRYQRGRAAAIGKMAQSLIQSGLSGNTTAQIFYLKTQGGWKEPDRGDDGDGLADALHKLADSLPS